MRPIDADALIEFCEERWIPLNIDAVNMQPTIQPEKEQLSCEGTTSDMVSRQAVIDALDVLCQEHRYRIPGKRETYSEYNEAWQDALGRAEGVIGNLPTIQPEPKEGHWIPHETPDGGEQYECSRCGVLWEFTDGTPEDNEAYFCPKCGKKLITK